ncbi:MAG: succinic semialdehyde dehydrogenase [Nocardioides sp.]|uniref:succinic semialdehyde dehydrogenase n=1 Tax=Nocardioides sp. TaxID=35761 RepID=UPI003F09DDB0
MSEPTPDGQTGGLVDGPRDPEHDPSAHYALERSDVEALAARQIATTGRTRLVVSPLGGQPLAHLPESSATDVTEAFRRARVAQKQWARTPLDTRSEALLRLHDLLLDHQAELIDLVVWESGKARKDAFLEVAHLAMTARYYARTAHQHLDTRRVPGLFPVLTRAEVNRVPKGVVGIISPWNYPLTLALCDGLPALLAGNAVVSKPDSQTTLTALMAARLLDQAGFPKDLWQVVVGPPAEVGGAVVAQADYVCFTGSTATGKLIAAQCAERLIGCSLELGGKNPMLVLHDANLDAAAEGAVRAVFSNAGQLCISVERLFVADQVYDRFVEQFVARTRAMTLGASQDWAVDMGSLVSQAQLDKVTSHVEDAVAKGARVLAGGKARPDLGPYVFEPTILEGVTASMDLFAAETFGPVVSVYRFHDEGEAVERANQGSYGLNASVWTRDGDRGRAVARSLVAGTVNVNEGYGAAFGSLAAPMGGMRESGLGRRQGAEGILRYTETQSVGTQRVLPIRPVLGMSEESYAKVMTTALRVLKKVGRA